MMQRYYLNCERCGTRFMAYSSTRLYCSNECKLAAREERKAKTRKQLNVQKKRLAYSKPLVPEKKCLTCIYVGSVGGIPCCQYFSVTGTTRTFLHPEGLTAECKEYEPKNGRHLRVNFSLDGGDTSSIREDAKQEDEDRAYLARL